MALRATLVSLLLFGAYYVNYMQGWITPDDLNLFGKPPNADGTPS